MKKFYTAILLFFCFFTLGAQENYSPELAAAFNRAGIQPLGRRIPSLDFSLPLVVPIGFIQKNISLESLRGKVVFLNFWATWCGPCRAEMPSMEALYSRFKKMGFEILAVNDGETNNEALEFMRSGRFTFPALLDSSGEISMSYGVRAIPSSFLIDRDGMIVARIVGSLDWNRPEILDIFEELLK